MLSSGITTAQEANVSTYRSSSKLKTHTYRSNTGVASTDLEYRGKIIFTDDDRDVRSISSGGFIKFSKRTFGTKRTIVLEGNANGTITREFYEGSRELPFEPEGRKWMESVLPEIIRNTGLGADTRVARFYKKGGIDAVLNEIEEINSSYVGAIYYNATFSLSGVRKADIAKAVEHAGENISSSYELGKLLSSNASLLLADKNTSAAMEKATSEISSDYEQAKVYKTILKANLDDNTIQLVIDGLDNISSNYEKSGVLTGIITYDLSDENLELIFEAVADMSSSYEQSKVLQILIKEQYLNEVTSTRLLSTTKTISSSYEKSKVVQTLINSKQLTSKEIAAVADFSQAISSDYEQSKLLQSLVNNESADEEGLDMIIKMSSSISSSYEQAKLLSQVLDSRNFKGKNFLSAIEASEDISSGYERSKVLTKVIKHDNIRPRDYKPLIEAVSDISSSYERSKLLMIMAPDLPNDSEVRASFFEAAKSLSDSDYGKVMRAVTH